MTATTDAIEWTRTALRELPSNGRRYEIIDGRLYVSPPAGEDHQAMGVRLAATIRPGESHGIAWPFPIKLEAIERSAG